MRHKVVPGLLQPQPSVTPSRERPRLNRAGLHAPLFASALLAASPAGAESSPSRRLDATIIAPGIGEAIDSYLRSAADLGFSGVVLVARNGRVILNQGYGYADRDRSVPFRPDTPFPLASIDKTFTAAAVLQLQDRGLLKVTDPVSKHIPGWPSDKAGMTIHHLLTHTSGLPLDVGPDELQIDREAMLERAFKAPLLSPPGAKWVYSNLGLSLAAVIVENVSGEPFPHYMQRAVFRPAGMVHTRYRTRAEARDIGYCGYRSFLSACVTQSSSFFGSTPSWIVTGNAGHIGTAADLHRWHEALRGGSVLSIEAQKAATTAHFPTTLGGSAGYGWFVTNLKRSGKVVYHTGGDGVVAAKYERFLDRDLVVAQFSNNGSGVFSHIANEVPKIALGTQPVLLPKATHRLSRSQLQAYAGTYRLPDGQQFRITVQNGQLYIPLESAHVAGLLSGQPQEGAESQQAAAATAVKVLTAVERGDLSTMLANLPDGADVAEEREFWSTWWTKTARLHGGTVDAVALGASMEPQSTGAGQTAPKRLQVRVLVRLKDGLQYMTATDVGGGRWYLNPTNRAPLPPGGFRFISVERNAFLTRSFPTKADSRLAFSRHRSGRLDVRISLGTRSIVAQRLRLS